MAFSIEAIRDSAIRHAGLPHKLDVATKGGVGRLGFTSDGGPSSLTAGFGHGPGTSELDPASFCRSERVPCPRPDQASFVLRKGRHDVHGQLGSVWHIAGHEGCTGFHQGTDESHVTRQTVEFGNHEDCTVLPGQLQRGSKLGPIALGRSGFDFDDFLNDFQTAMSREGVHSMTLSFQTQATLALLGGGDSVVGDGCRHEMECSSLDRDISEVLQTLKRPI